jgi:hypothetical protein
MLLPSSVIRFSTLKKSGYTELEIKKKVVSLTLFPTPFKGIYYIPFEDERKSRTLHDPMKALTMSIEMYLDSDRFYYTCRSALEWLGVEWHPSGLIHIANEKISKRIGLETRVSRKQMKKTYYSKTSAGILAQYGREIIFHKCKSMGKAKYKETPSGRFATEKQVKEDKKRFRCK